MYHYWIMSQLLEYIINCSFCARETRAKKLNFSPSPHDRMCAYDMTDFKNVSSFS